MVTTALFQIQSTIQLLRLVKYRKHANVLIIGEVRNTQQESPLFTCT